MTVNLHTVRGVSSPSGRATEVKTPPTNRLWTVEDVSYYLAVPVGTLYYWRVNRVGPPARRIGRYLRYRSEDVIAWVNAHSEVLD